MTRRTGMLFFVLSAAGPVAFAQEPPAPDLVHGAVDPYEVGKQRVVFLRVAGVDGELSASEFTADEQGNRLFVKVFDRWPAMIEFDRDKNGSLDWLEADAYRQDIRARVISRYDSDKNRKLNGPERTQANEALAKGLIPPRSAKPDPAVSAPAPTPSAPQANAPDTRTDPEKFVDAIMSVSDDEVDFSNMQAELTKHFDTNGNGTLDPDESQEYGRLMQKRILDNFDTNGDGVIDALEEIHQMDRMQDIAVKRMDKQMSRMFDFNRDGELDEREKEQAENGTRMMREQWEGARAQRLRKYDKDGNGELSLEEAKAYRESRMERGRRSMEFMVKHFDLDGNGQMDTQEEFQAMQRHQMKTLPGLMGPAGPSAENIKRFDEDGDGKLLGEEMEEMMTQLMIENPPGKE